MSDEAKKILRYIFFLPASIATGIIAPSLFIFAAAWAGSPMVSGWTLEYLILLPSILMAGVFGGWMSIIVGIIVAPKKSIFVLIVLGVSTAVFSADKILNGAIFESNIVNSQTIALFLGNILYLITSFGVLANTYLRPDEDLF